jgi:hypothetical protein
MPQTVTAVTFPDARLDVRRLIREYLEHVRPSGISEEKDSRPDIGRYDEVNLSVRHAHAFRKVAELDRLNVYTHWFPPYNSIVQALLFITLVL